MTAPDYEQLREAAAELLDSLDGIAVRAPERQALRYSIASDRLLALVHPDRTALTKTRVVR